MEAVWIQIAAFAEGCNRLFEPRPNRVSLSCRIGFGRLRQRANSFEAGIQHERQSRALASPHRQQGLDRLVEIFQRARARGGDRSLGFGCVDDFDDAPHGQKPIEARRLKISGKIDVSHRRHELAEKLVIDADIRVQSLALNRQRSVKRSARQPVREPSARVSFNRLERRRQTQPRVETLGVDGFELPRPAVSADAARDPGKTSHAGDCHCFKLECWRSGGLSAT